MSCVAHLREAEYRNLAAATERSVTCTQDCGLILKISFKFLALYDCKHIPLVVTVSLPTTYPKNHKGLKAQRAPTRDRKNKKRPRRN